MTSRERPPRFLSSVARFLLVGDEGRLYHADLDESFQRDLRRSLPRGQARRRYALNLLGSAWSLWTGGGLRGAARGATLDFKLGARMLVKYPGLTLVGGLAMAFAIWAGTVSFEVVRQLTHPTLPLPAGERVVHIESWDAEANRSEPRQLHDFLLWRDEIESVTELGAWRDLSRTMIVAGGSAAPVEVAEMTASGFRVAGAGPALGRVLVPEDERTGAPPVAVIGYDLWQRRFGGDPGVLGRSVQLGDEHATVVGVMPAGFAFPVSHELWTPLRTDVPDPGPRAGPAIGLFGLLAPGATVEAAQAELTALGRPGADDPSATPTQLRPLVSPFAAGVMGISNADEQFTRTLLLFPLMLLVLVCSDVALLVFARAATRESEIVVRAALGAGRARIVVQLFAEALVLGAGAAIVGLLVADLTLRTWGVGFLEANLGRLPFWYDLRVSPTAVVVATALTVLGSAIAGVVPALKVTRGMGSRLRQAAPGAGGLRFGGIWTVVIVVQVALTVAFPALLWVEQWELRYAETFEAGFAAEEYLAARIDFDPDSVPSLGAKLDALRARVAAEPGVAGVTFVDRLPRSEHPQSPIEVDGVSSRGSGERFVATLAGIDPSYFQVLGAPMLAGRPFQAVDLGPDARVAIVDVGFVEEVLEGRNALGRRVRFVDGDGEPAEPGSDPGYEIVGVVRELGMGTPTRKGRAAGFYLPVSPERLGEVQLVAHVRGDPTELGPRVREIAETVDPTLRISEIQRVDQVTDVIVWVVRLWLRITAVVSAVALLLSLAGIYAVLSFTVARRTREIGVRVAVGASRRRVIAEVFRRPLSQVALGVVAGAALIFAGTALLATSEFPGVESLADGLSIGQVASIFAYALLMLAVCLLACVVPTRCALAVQPTVALRAE